MDGTESVGRREQQLRFCRLKLVELGIIRVLWDAGVPLTAREVFEELHRRGRCSYLTIRTTMTRMVEAGVLEQRRRKRSNLYEPTVDRHAVAATCVEEIINQVLGGDLCHGVVSLLRHMPLSRDALRVIRRSVFGATTRNERGATSPTAASAANGSVADAGVSSPSAA